MAEVRQIGTRIEELLTTLRGSGNPAAAPAAEELIRLLLGLYGDGLGHIMAALRESGDEGAAVLDRLLADPLVESLLVLHDLHPLDVDARIQRALDRVRPYLGSHAGGVEYLGVTDDGVAHLRLEGSCHGCPSSTVTVRLAIQGAIEEAAPEVSDVLVEGVTEPAGQQALLQIGSGPPGPPVGGVGGAPGPGAGGRRHLGHPARPRAAQRASAGHGGRRPAGARLLGPRHPVRLPRCLRGVRILPGPGQAGQ
jgi:Fe-S cluster biogenesis protein NfuA